MTIYTATFRTAAEYAVREFEADTPEQALQAARELWEHAAELLTFEDYDRMMPLDEIEISGDEGSELAIWIEPDMGLRLAAGDLLDALDYCVMTLADLQASRRKGYIAHAMKQGLAAIAKAKGGVR